MCGNDRASEKLLPTKKLAKQTVVTLEESWRILTDGDETTSSDTWTRELDCTVAISGEPCKQFS